MLLCVWRYFSRWLPAFLVVAIIASLVISEWGARNFAMANYFLPTARVWELALGALLSVSEQRRPDRVRSSNISDIAGLLGLGLIAAGLLMFDEHTRHPGLITLVPVLGTALLIRFGADARRVARILSAPLLVGTGLISYSLYLWHQPVYAFARGYSIGRLQPIAYAGLIALSVALAVISWKYVETPFRNRSLIAARKIWALSAAGLIFFVLAGTIGNIAQGFPGRFPDAVELLKNFRATGPAAAALPWRSAPTAPDCTRDRHAACIIGDPGAPPTYALVGDSHADSLIADISAELRKRKLSGLLLTRAGCPYALQLRHSGRSLHCDPWAQAVKERLAKDDLETVILVGRYVMMLENSRFDNQEGGIEAGAPVGFLPVQGSGAAGDDTGRRGAILESYEKSISELLQFGKRVVLIYPIPEVGWDVPHTLFKLRHMGSPGLSTSHAVYLARSQGVIEVFDRLGEHANLVRVRPDSLLCNTWLRGRCATHVGVQALYHDDDHLNERGASLLVRGIFSGMDRKWAP